METPDGYFSDQLTLEQGAIIFFNDGKLDNGQDYYLYIAVKGTHVKDYFTLLNKPHPPSMDDLKRVGTIIAFGEGKPSVELRHYLGERYGVYHS